ncbi:hypothetical protein P9209_24165 [Prescottella defluvii]|nr:hypothetical protein P9209_24165 [Prescottella defluvii]
MRDAGRVADSVARSLKSDPPIPSPDIVQLDQQFHLDLSTAVGESLEVVEQRAVQALTAHALHGRR